MNETLGTTGLILNEPLLWERGKRGRSGFSLPRRDVDDRTIFAAGTPFILGTGAPTVLTIKMPIANNEFYQ